MLTGIFTASELAKEKGSIIHCRWNSESFMNASSSQPYDVARRARVRIYHKSETSVIFNSSRDFQNLNRDFSKLQINNYAIKHDLAIQQRSQLFWTLAALRQFSSKQLKAYLHRYWNQAHLPTVASQLHIRSVCQCVLRRCPNNWLRCRIAKSCFIA